MQEYTKELKESFKQMQQAIEALDKDLVRRKVEQRIKDLKNTFNNEVNDYFYDVKLSLHYDNFYQLDTQHLIELLHNESNLELIDIDDIIDATQQIKDVQRFFKRIKNQVRDLEELLA